MLTLNQWHTVQINHIKDETDNTFNHVFKDRHLFISYFVCFLQKYFVFLIKPRGGTQTTAIGFFLQTPYDILYNPYHSFFISKSHT